MARMKTGVLIALVIVSAFLANSLMSGQPVAGTPGKLEPVWYGPEPGLNEVSLPGRIYIISPQREALLVETFSRMFNDLVVTLGESHYDASQGGPEWATGEYPRSGFPTGILFRYDYQISRELLAGWMTMFFETDFPFAAIDSVFVPLEQGPVLFINSSTEEVWLFNVTLPWTVIAQAVNDPRDTISYPWVPMGTGENYSAAPGVFDIAEPDVLVVPQWYREEINYDALLRSFYLEPALIQEPDGTEIYTDGLQALRIFPSGAVEYTVAGFQRELPLPLQQELVEASLRFITAHGGWPGSLLPTELGIWPAEHVRLQFSSYCLGLPIIAEDSGIVVEMDGLEVSSYIRNLVRGRPNAAAEYVEVLPLTWHLSRKSSQFAKYYMELHQEITDLALIYYWQQDQLIPAWRVWAGKQVVFVGAADGRILNIREQSGGK